MNIIFLTRTVIIYFFLIVVLRIMGKREIGQIGIFDMVLLLIIADISVLAIDDTSKPLYLFLLAVILIGALQKLFSYISLKVTKVRNLIDGNPVVIMYDGKLNITELKKENLNVDEIISEARLRGFRTLHEVEVALIETSGKISFFQKKNVEQRENPLPIIVSGQVVQESLDYIDITEKQLEKIAKKPIKNIYYATYENGILTELEYFNEWDGRNHTDKKSDKQKVKVRGS